VEKLAGVLKTSTILISADDIDGVYRSMQDVPEPLRKRLLRTTNGVNSRTILIADRRGRQEIAKALKNCPALRSGAVKFAFDRENATSAAQVDDCARWAFCSREPPACWPGSF
jgi:hypothetical protein